MSIERYDKIAAYKSPNIVLKAHYQKNRKPW